MQEQFPFSGDVAAGVQVPNPDYWDQLALHFFDSRHTYQGCPDEILARLIAREWKPGWTDRFARDFVIEQVGKGEEIEFSCSLVRSSLRAGLFIEGGARFQKRNHETGRAIIEFIHNPEAASVRKVGNYVTKGLDHPEYPKHSREGKEELTSLVWPGLIPRIMEEVVMVGRDYLESHALALIRGDYQRIGENVHHSISDQLQVMSGHRQRNVAIERIREPDDATHTGPEKIILVEEYLNHPALDQREKMLLGMSYRDHTQAEIARKLGVSRSAISQRLQTIRTKLSKK